ncbi:MAG: OsmC family protein [Bacteroidota bacterium]|nr:OsmC family protein [Bacteroidota bacterium]
METIAATPEPKVKHKTFTYRTTLRWEEKKRGVLSSAGKPTLTVSSPPEFKGEAGIWSPEDMFVAAVDACTMTTFMSFAQRLQLPVSSYSSEAEGVLEFVDGEYRFTKIILKPRILVSSLEAIEQLKKTLEDAHRSCLIGHSIKAEVDVVPEIALAEEQK